jgi:saccharopine dehydrogenase-like NADP-dependent oxidoreductase
MEISVLGAGLVGRAIILDLSSAGEFAVTAVDNQKTNLDQLPGIILKKEMDVTQSGVLEQAVKEAELVVNALPGAIGFQILKRLIKAGKSVVDISFFPEDMLLLKSLAEEKGVTVICDMGVAPGMSNLLAAYAARDFSVVKEVKIAVGGLPLIRTKPFEYKAPFSPADVLEEYIRPARIVRNGEVVEVQPLSGLEAMEFDEVGSLEAFVTDGLRSLTTSLRAENMVEKTLRYPGYAEKIQLLKTIGFFDEKPVEVAGKLVKPFDVASQLLLPMWKLHEGEEDFTVMRISVEGLVDGKQQKVQWNLYDTYDRQNIHSMARTTGYAATAVTRLIAKGRFTRKGLFGAEQLAETPQEVKTILDELSVKGVVFTEKRSSG